MTLLPFDPLLGLDNAFVALALGPLLGGRAARLGALFGGVGFLAAAAGSALHAMIGSMTIGMPAIYADVLRAGALVGVAVACLALAVVSRLPRGVAAAPALVGLALLLSVDDLIAGLALDPSAMTFGRLASGGIACGVLSMGAAFVGAAFTRFLAVRDAALVSAGLLLGCSALGLT